MNNRAEFRQKHAQQKRNTTLAVVIGLGLMALAVVLFINMPKAGFPVSTQVLSTIPVEVNYQAPALALENTKGKTESLADFHDKVVLVNNWATWCPPCKAEMPTLVDFYNEHAKDGLMIVAIEAGESKDQVQEFADLYKMPFSVWVDPDGKSLNAFKNGNLPNSYVIDRTGTVRLMWTGEINRETLEKYVTPMLAKN
ncbi:MAG: TlpA disulfide reductase family protein [Chloroflexota bacterium]